MPHRSYLKWSLVMFVVIVLATIITSFNISSASSSGQQPPQVSEVNEFLPGRIPQLVQNSRKMGRMAKNEPMMMVISFKPHHQAELQVLIDELYKPTSPLYHHWLTPEEYGKRFGRTETEFNNAVEWLRSQGFQIEQAWPNQLAVTFSGNVETTERAFQVEIAQYQDATNRLFYSNTQLPKLPEQLAGMTLSIHGLNSAYEYKRPKRTLTPSPELQSQLESIRAGIPVDDIKPAGRIGGSPIFISPKDIGTAYNLTSVTAQGTQGQGQRVGVVIDSDVADADINAHRQLFKLPQANLKRLVPPGQSNPGTKFEVEAELDVESISSVAPMAEINIVTVSDLRLTSIFNAEQFIINTAKIPVVNESFGLCEVLGFDPAERNLFLQAMSQGIAFFVSSGDEGTADCIGFGDGRQNIGTPAAYDGVTAVGGTQIDGQYDGNGDLTSIKLEDVWNDAPGVRIDCNGNFLPNAGGAGGGGISKMVDRPSYQTSATGFSGGVPAGTKRVVPDISLLAGNPFTVIAVQGQAFIGGGGTSQSSPLWAGLMTLVNQAKGTPQGSPNNEIYRLGTAQFRDKTISVYRDITSGNNNVAPVSPCASGGTKGFDAVVGFDAATGWGVPNFANFIATYGTQITGDTSAPRVNVRTPNGGETVKSGDQFTINWFSVDDKGIASQDITLSTDGGSTFPVTVVAGLAASAQSFIWTVPNNLTSQARIKISATDAAKNVGSDTSDASFTIVSGDTTPPTVSVKAPAGSESLKGGDKFTINWASTDNKMLASHDLTLSTDGGATFPVTIVTGLAGTAQSFEWTVPAINTDKAKVRVTAFDGAGNAGTGDSTNAFRIAVSDFTLAVTPATLTVAPGKPATFSISAQPLNGFTGSINLTSAFTPVDSSISTTLSAASLTIGGSPVMLTVNTAPDTMPKTLNITVTGTSGQLVHTSMLTLNVVAPDFSLAFNPGQISINRKQKTNVTLNINRIGDFGGSVTISAPDTKALMIKVKPGSQSTTSNSLSFTIKTKATSPTGLQQLIFTGKDDAGRARTATLMVMIQ